MTGHKKQLKNKRPQWLLVLLLLSAVPAIIGGIGIIGRVLGAEEAERYCAFCEGLGFEMPLWLFRSAPVLEIFAGVLVFAGAALWILHFWGARDKQKIQKIWLSLLTVTYIVIVAGVGVRAYTNIQINNEAKAKMDQTIEAVLATNADKFLLNDEKYVGLFSYYFSEFEWLNYIETDFGQIDEEHVYMLCEEGFSLANDLVETYGMSYTDMGALWFEGAEQIRLLKVHWGKYGAEIRSEAAVNRVREREADKVLVSMFEMDNFREEYFELFLGGSMVNFSEAFLTGEQLIAAVEKLIYDTSTVQTLYLGVNPLRFEMEDWDDLKGLLQRYPDVNVRAFLQHPSKSRLLDDELLANFKNAVRMGVASMNEVDNASLLYVGSEDWVLLNDANRIKDNLYSDEMAYHLSADVLINQLYIINEENVDTELDTLEEILLDVRSGEYDYVHLDEKTILFIGDSIFESIKGSFSVPGVVAGLTGAGTYNLGYGGMTAAWRPDVKEGVWGMVQGILTSDFKAHDLLGKPYFCEQAELLKGDGVLNGGLQGEELVFVFNFGLNDYFEGVPIGEIGAKDRETYVGALEETIELLMERYPKAKYVVLGSNHIVKDDYGTQKKGPEGNVLNDYRTALRKLAEAMNIEYIDMNAKMGFTKENIKELLNDGVHLKHSSCFWYGKVIADYLEECMRSEGR